MSWRREVLIRILALLQRKTLIETKKCLKCIKMLKTALFDCAINEKWNGWAQLELTDALRKMMRRQVCSRQVNAVNCQTITVFRV